LSGWRKRNQASLLVTVVRTWGASPRPVGSIMALCEDGTIVGSVSGGCIEDDLIARHQAETNNAWHTRIGTERLAYGITAGEAHRFGLPCGGTLELVVEYNPCADQLITLVEQLDAGRLMRRRLCLDNGRVKLARAEAPAELTIDETTLAVSFG